MRPMAPAPGALERTFRPPHPVSLGLTLGPLRRGRGDPTMRIDDAGVWRASRTPAGVATAHLVARGGAVTVRAWGPGAEWALDAAPALVGAGDDPAGFAPRHPVLAELHRRMPGLRIPRSQAVVEALVPTVLEQRVTVAEARRSYAAIVRRHGEVAPGPAGLLAPPEPAVLAAVPSYALHPLGVERARAETLRRACAAAHRLEEATAMGPHAARRRLCVLPGLGPWSAAMVAIVALGDADAVIVGDLHLPHLVCWALAGEARGDDARMLELLEPYRGHRGRAVRLLASGGLRSPRSPALRPPARPIAWI